MEQDLKLPALREVGAIAEQVEIPGSEILGFLTYLNSELMKAIDILREETQESLVDGDAAERIATLNRLRLRKRKLHSHFQKEITEVRGILRGLREDKAVMEALNSKIRDVSREIGLALEDLVSEFEV